MILPFYFPARTKKNLSLQPGLVCICPEPEQTTRNRAGWILQLALLFASSITLPARADNTYPITWNWPSNQTAAAVQAQYPWMRMDPERVNIELSLNGGATYRSLATGVPSQQGDNTWTMNLPDTADYLSTAARVRISSMPQYRQVQTRVETPLVIAGIRLVNPPATVTNGASVTLRWVAAGAGSLVTLGTRAIGTQDWVEQAVFGSSDSNQGGQTNSATWAVTGLAPVPTEIILQSTQDPLCYRRHALGVAQP